MDKHAYQLGAMAALHDLGIVGDGQTKTAAGEAGMLRRGLEAAKGMGSKAMSGIGSLPGRFTDLSSAEQALLAMGAGGAAGAGLGSLGDEAGTGALIGAGIGGGAIGGRQLARRLARHLGDRQYAQLFQLGGARGQMLQGLGKDEAAAGLRRLHSLRGGGMNDALSAAGAGLGAGAAGLGAYGLSD